MLEMFAKPLYKLGLKFRNPSFNAFFQSLKATDFESKEELENIQLKKLKSLLEHAGEYSPFYSKLFKEIEFDPKTVNSLDVLAKLPFSDKDIYLENCESIHSTYSFKKVRLAQTSGSSGQSLRFQRSEEWDSFNRASVARAYSWYGVDMWDRNGYLWGYNISSAKARVIRFFDSIQNRVRIFTYDKAAILRFAKKTKNAKFITGYSSMIYEIAKVVNEQGLDYADIKMVKGTSEAILPGYQPEVEKAFGVRMVSEYGAAESGLIAFECPEGNMHVNMEGVILEQDDTGEVVITNLNSHSFPIIRYRLGDSIQLSQDECSCGRKHTILKDLQGRKGTQIFGKNEHYPPMTFYNIFKNIAVVRGLLLNFQVVQSKKGFVVVYIEGEINQLVKEAIGSEFEKFFKDDLEYSIEPMPEFKNQAKKRQYFVSEIEG